MANTKKYVSLDKLGLYDEKIKTLIGNADTAVLNSAKEYANGLATNYDAAGSAATVQGNLDTEIARAKAEEERIAGLVKTAQDEVDALELVVDTKADKTALEGFQNTVSSTYETKEDAGKKLTEAKTYTDTEVKKATDAVSALAGKVGEVAEGSTVVEMIGAVEDVAEANAGAIEVLEGKVQGLIEGTYDDTEIRGLITANAEAIEALEGVHADDKSELEGKIDLKADKTALEEEVNRAKGVEGGLEDRIETMEAFWAAAQADGTDSNVVDTLKEIQEYIVSDETGAAEMLASIQANAKAISDHEALAAQTYETKEDATAKYDEVKAEIAAIPQADWNQNDPAAADYVKNRTHYDGETRVEIVAEKTIDCSISIEGERYKYTDYDYANLGSGRKYLVVWDGVEYYCESQAGGTLSVSDSGTVSADSPFIIEEGGMGAMNYYALTQGEHTVAIYTVESSIKQLDEKFIPDTIARVADVEAVETRMGTAEGKITTLEGKVSTNETAISALQEADAGIIERVAAVEAQLGDGEGSVADMIADAKQEAIDAAAADATTKANNAEANAKGHADGLNTAMDARVVALETASATHALKSEVEGVAGRVTTVEGKVTTLEGKMTAVEALAAANKSAHEANAAAIALKASQADLEAVSGRVTTLETWHNNFQECSEQDILDLF